MNFCWKLSLVWHIELGLSNVNQVLFVKNGIFTLICESSASQIQNFHANFYDSKNMWVFLKHDKFIMACIAAESEFCISSQCRSQIIYSVYSRNNLDYSFHQCYKLPHLCFHGFSKQVSTAKAIWIYHDWSHLDWLLNHRLFLKLWQISTLKTA